MPPKSPVPPTTAKPPYPAAKAPAKPELPETSPTKPAPATKGKPAPKVPVVPLKESMARRLAK